LHVTPIEPDRFEVPDPEVFAASCDRIRGDAALDDRGRVLVDTLALRWRTTFERFGHDNAGELNYRDILLDLRERVIPKLAADSEARRTAMSLAAVMDPKAAMVPARSPMRRPRRASDAELVEPPRFDRPLFILSAPRSGSTLLFDLLARSPELWTIGGESHEIIRAIDSLDPAMRGYASDCLDAEHATPDTVAALQRGFTARLVDRDGRPWIELPPDQRPGSLRLLEKTPANALRVPFLHAAFPNALFIHLVRDPRPTISSLVEGWRSRKFVKYRDFPGWPHREWSFLLPPGWSDYAERSLVEIAAFQWRATNHEIIAALAQVPTRSQLRLQFEPLLEGPAAALAKLAEFADIPPSDLVDSLAGTSLPLSRVALSPPDPEKWRRHEREIERLLPTLTLDASLSDPTRGAEHA
jgi:hypothetical protein